MAVPVNMLSCIGEIPHKVPPPDEEINTGYQWLLGEEESVSCDEGEGRLSYPKTSALNAFFTHVPMGSFKWTQQMVCVHTRVYGGGCNNK